MTRTTGHLGGRRPTRPSRSASGSYLLVMDAGCLHQAAEEMAQACSGTAEYWDGPGRDAWRKFGARQPDLRHHPAGTRHPYSPPRPPFDTHPDLLNVPNGVLSLRTLALGEHDPDLLFTQVAGAPWVPGARHPDIDKALVGDSRDVLGLRPVEVRPGHHRPQAARRRDQRAVRRRARTARPPS